MVLAVFVAPFVLEATQRFIAAASGVEGVELAVVSQQPLEALPESLRHRLAAHHRVEDALDAAQLAGAVADVGRRLGRPVERLFGVLEQLQEPMAEARRMLGLPGLQPEVARRFRDKSHMKDVLRAAGVPCARHRLVGDAGAAVGFVEEVGFPLVAKPPAGAGAQSTFRLDDVDGLRRWFDATAPTPERPALLEEFLVGDEATFDSVVLDGRVVWHSISLYLPTPLDVLRNPWMQWAVLFPRDITGPEFAPIREAGPAALRALGIDHGLTHMEWFRRADGSVAISEVAARPPGAQISSMLGWAYDLDFHRTWAELEVLGRFPCPERRWAAGAAYVRGQGSGRVVRVTGLEELQAEFGPLVVEAKLPELGQAPRDSYEGEGFVIVRHEDTPVVVEALRQIVTRLRVELG